MRKASGRGDKRVKKRLKANRGVWLACLLPGKALPMVQIHVHSQAVLVLGHTRTLRAIERPLVRSVDVLHMGTQIPLGGELAARTEHTAVADRVLAGAGDCGQPTSKSRTRQGGLATGAKGKGKGQGQGPGPGKNRHLRRRNNENQEKKKKQNLLSLYLGKQTLE